MLNTVLSLPTGKLKTLKTLLLELISGDDMDAGTWRGDWRLNGLGALGSKMRAPTSENIASVGETAR